MSKRARHQPGFYASFLDDVHDRGLSYKYRPKEKPVVVGTYEVELIVSKRNQGGNVGYFIQWKNYCSTGNTWGPSEHLSEDLIAAFEKDQSILFASTNAEIDLLFYLRRV